MGNLRRQWGAKPLPVGLEPEMVTKAIEIIEEWRDLEADLSYSDLIIELFELFSQSSSKISR